MAVRSEMMPRLMLCSSCWEVGRGAGREAEGAVGKQKKRETRQAAMVDMEAMVLATWEVGVGMKARGCDSQRPAFGRQGLHAR